MSGAAMLATGRVLILTGDVALLDGRLVRTPPAGDVAHLLRLIAGCFRGTGVVLLDEHNAQTYGLPDSLFITHEDGWRGTYRDGWAKLRHDQHPTIHLGLLGDLDPHRCPLLEYLPVVEGEQLDAPVLDVDATAQAFVRWQQLTGQPWFGTPGAAGWDVLAPMLDRGRERRGGKPAVTMKPARTGPGDAQESAYWPRQWSPPEPELPWTYRHGYDATRMYLAALCAVEVAPFTLRPTGRIPFDPRLAGWWLIDVPPWNDPRVPDPAGYGERRRWVTTPTAALLAELAQHGTSAGFEVLDSYTGPGRRLFRQFGELMEAGYQHGQAHDDPGLSRAFKAAGAREVIGLMNTGAATFSTHRPDWHHAIIALARVNLWRKIIRVAGSDRRWPERVDVDCLWYGSDNPDPVAACPPSLQLGDRLGQFKIKGSR